MSEFCRRSPLIHVKKGTLPHGNALSASFLNVYRRIILTEKYAASLPLVEGQSVQTF